MQPQGLDLIDIIHKGAIATYPLILLSIVSVAVVFERLWSLRNIGAITLRVTESILEPIKKGQRDLAIAICKQNSHSPAGRIFLNILERDAGARLEVANSIAAEAMFEENQKLKKHLWILGTVASSAPFIGLLGTVVGIIKSFESMAIAGTGGFAVVAAGISEALVATALGLAVAIIAVIFYNYFQTRISTLNGLFRIQVGKIRPEHERVRNSMAITPLGGNDDSSEIVAEINITPLTDIFLVLLIIFMITSSAMIESGGKINLPKAVATQSESRGTTVTITPKHEIFVDQKVVKEENLEKTLQDALTTRADKTVILRGDKDVLLGDTVKVMSIIKRAGASEIAIAAEAERKVR